MIDDNIWDARLMRRLFEARQRFSVLEAHNAENAWKILQNQPPDLVILDLMLPDEQGESILKRMRQNSDVSQVPVIIVSAKEIEPETRADLTIYADSIWSKTMLDRNSLLVYVENLLTN